jgi:multicomponent Na+:H+ antiporter subunit G
MSGGIVDIVVLVLTWLFLGIGVVFSVIGGIGMLRLPDFYTRMHAAGMIDTMGAGMILLGLMLQGGWTIVTIKLVLIGVFIFFTSPVSTHAVAKAALSSGLEPYAGPAEGDGS